MGQILIPHRGKKSTMASTKNSIVLSNGELFVEYPDTGIGSGHHRIKIGNGTTKYSELPYAVGDTVNDPVTANTSSSTTVAQALTAISSGGALGDILGDFYYAVNTHYNEFAAYKTSVTDSFSSVNSQITALTTRVNGMANISMSVIPIGSTLPTTGATNVIYLVDASTTASNNGSDIYEMYVWMTTTSGGYYNKIGNSQVDLSLYDKIADRQSADNLLQSQITNLSNSLGTQATISLSNTTLTITTK